MRNIPYTDDDDDDGDDDDDDDDQRALQDTRCSLHAICMHFATYHVAV